MSNAPLSGLKILSLAEQFPGPYATMLLSDMGAEVIMIERPGLGDPARQFPPLFRALNRGGGCLARGSLPAMTGYAAQSAPARLSRDKPHLPQAARFQIALA